MNKLLAISLCLLMSAYLLQAGDPAGKIESCCPVVYETSEVDLSYDIDKFDKLFSPAFYNEKTKSLHFESYHNIKFVQVYDSEGKLEYQLPVMSNKIRLSKKMFDPGQHKITFHIEGQDDALLTYVNIY